MATLHSYFDITSGYPSSKTLLQRLQGGEAGWRLSRVGPPAPGPVLRDLAGLFPLRRAAAQGRQLGRGPAARAHGDVPAA